MDDIHQEVRFHIHIVSDRMNECYNIRATEGDHAEATGSSDK